MPLDRRTRRKRMVIFSTFFLCCFGASLLASALATENWFEANSRSGLNESHGHVNFGMFEGKSSIFQIIQRTHSLKVVCLEGKCMYSCAPTKALRQEQMRQVMDGTAENFPVAKYCKREEATYRRLHPLDFHPLSLRGSLVGGPEGGRPLQSYSLKFLASHREWWWSPPNSLPLRADADQGGIGDSLTTEEIPEEEEEQSTESTTIANDPVDPAVFMNYGLWVGTVACLSLGMMFAVIGALFAVINTATTPVEAITGVPGLYAWNALAALFNLICVILWAVQFHENLSKNVLLYDAPNGWTTEGMEVLGYSFWLVVVAIFVHVANIAIIFIGTYEPKVKEQVQAPDTKGSNIMLY